MGKSVGLVAVGFHNASAEVRQTEPKIDLSYQPKDNIVFHVQEDGHPQL